MEEKRYFISDASKLLDVESHVLRYWEEELEINIPRNEMGHRYYTENHINLLKNVRELKKQGYGLKAIKMMINDTEESLPEVTVRENKLEQFQSIMNEIVTKALIESHKELGKEVSGQVSTSVIKEMDYLLRAKEEREEQRYKKLDETIRMYQRGRKEAAATREKRNIKFKLPKLKKREKPKGKLKEE